MGGEFLGWYSIHFFHIFSRKHSGECLAEVVFGKSLRCTMDVVMDDAWKIMEG